MRAVNVREHLAHIRTYLGSSWGQDFSAGRANTPCPLEHSQPSHRWRDTLQYPIVTRLVAASPTRGSSRFLVALPILEPCVCWCTF